MPERPLPEYYVGLISGTSMDGIDAVVADFSTEPPCILSAATYSFDPELSDVLETLRGDPDRFPTGRLGRLDALLGDGLGDAALETVRAAGLTPDAIRAIGSHGQTVVHHADERPPHTLQIGDPWRLAARTATTVVADFRRSDLAAGGQGAPLAPLLHAALLLDDSEARAVVNLGGIANVTLLVPGRAVSGFDTGPANCFLDLWYRRQGRKGRYDGDGQWAASGTVDPEWLDRLLEAPYLQLAPPKSTGIEYFSPAWLEQRLPPWAERRPADVQATLAEFTAASVAAGIDAAGHDQRLRVLVCGGGVHNRDLMQRLNRRLPHARAVESTASHGLDPDYIEATLFAWLARRRLAGERVDTRPITGASRRVLAGTVFAL